MFGREHDLATYRRWGLTVTERSEGMYDVDHPVEKRMTLHELTTMIREFTECEGAVMVEVKPRKEFFNPTSEFVEEATANELAWEVHVVNDYPC